MNQPNLIKVHEAPFKPSSGYWAILIHLIVFAIGTVCFFYEWLASAGVFLYAVCLVGLRGYFVVEPNNAKVMILFGEYKGTVKSIGLHWANPFMQRTGVSLRARNLNGEKLKVNDNAGNPIVIAAVIVWQVEDTAKAIFEVEDYELFVSIQSEAAVRSLAGTYPYDQHDQASDISLRSGAGVVTKVLEDELSERLGRAGIKVIEARLSHLAYAQEIAQAMLQRQQAAAIVAARREIVEGAVSMVEMTLARLAEHQTVQLSEARKAALVSNLLVVLCSDRAAQPVVPAGSDDM